MQRSMGILLLVGILIIFGVFVIADTITPVTEGNNVTTVTQTPVPTDQNTTQQAEILVRFTPELWNTTALQSAANASHTYIGAVVVTDYAEMGLPGLQLVRLPPGMTAEEGIAYYQRLPYVKYAEKNAVYTIESSETSQETGTNATGSVNVSSNSTTTGPARLLVQFDVKAFKDPANLSDTANKVHATLNASLIKDFTPDGLAGLHLVALSANMTTDAGIAAYKNQSSVLFAEPDYKIKLSVPVK